MDHFGIIRIYLKQRIAWQKYNWTETANSTIEIREKYYPLIDDQIDTQKKERRIL